MERFSDKAVSLFQALGVHVLAALIMLLGLQASEPIQLSGGAPLEVSVSGGLRAVAPSDKPAPLADSMAEADAALYAAKSGGRNRIVLSDGSQMPPPAA